MTNDEQAAAAETAAEIDAWRRVIHETVERLRPTVRDRAELIELLISGVPDHHR